MTSQDSHASIASSRPSSTTIGSRPSTKHCRQQSAINAFLASHSYPISLKNNQPPSVKEITKILKFIISGLDFPLSTKFENDLSVILKSLKCPFMFIKSTFRDPNTPHNWPTYLDIIHWLVEIAVYKENLMSSLRSSLESNSMYMHALHSYKYFLVGDVDKEEILNLEFLENLEKERDSVTERNKALERNAGELAMKAESLRTSPTEREELEKQRIMLEDDVKKFHIMIEGYNGKFGAMEKALEEMENELSVKEEEKRMICEENEQLKGRMELQSFNVREVKRMKREMQAIERDIEVTEKARNSWEEKSSELDGMISQKFKEIEDLSMECNQAIKRFL